MPICYISHHLIMFSIQATKQNTPIADMQSVCHSKQRVMFILGSIVAWCHVPASGCDKERTLLEHYP